MSSHILIASLEFNQKTLDNLLAGVSEAQTLAFPDDSLDINIHWLVGLIASERDTLLEDLTGEMTFPQDMKGAYSKNSNARKLEKRINWQVCLEILAEQFNDISAWVLEWDYQGRLNQEKGDAIIKYLNNEAYYIGQIGLIKKMIVKTEKSPTKA